MKMRPEPDQNQKSSLYSDQKDLNQFLISEASTALCTPPIPPPPTHQHSHVATHHLPAPPDLRCMPTNCHLLILCLYHSPLPLIPLPGHTPKHVGLPIATPLTITTTLTPTESYSVSPHPPLTLENTTPKATITKT